MLTTKTAKKNEPSLVLAPLAAEETGDSNITATVTLPADRGTTQTTGITIGLLYHRADTRLLIGSHPGFLLLLASWKVTYATVFFIRVHRGMRQQTGVVLVAGLALCIKTWEILR